MSDDRNPEHPAALESSRLIDRQLFWAATKGQIDQVLELLKQGARTQYINESDPLETALNKGHLEIARLFLERGADPNKLTIKQTSLLFDNTRSNGVESMRLLLDHGADVNWLEVDKTNALHHMSFFEGEGSLVEPAKLLIERGIDKEQRDNQGATPLQRMAENEDLGAFEFMIEAGCDARVVNNQGQGLLHTAAAVGNTPVLMALIKRGFALDALDNAGKTALHTAAHAGHSNAVMVLLDHGADPHAKDLLGQTPRDLAMASAHADAVACMDAARAQAQIDAILKGQRPSACFAPG